MEPRLIASEPTPRARTRLAAGDVFAIPLPDGSGHAFCRYLDKLLTEFFDLRSMDVPTIDEVVKAPVAFSVWVSKTALASWQKIGHISPPPRPSPLFFKQDSITRRLSLWDNGRESPADLAGCAGLECAAVWSAEHIVDRLQDHFAGRQNKWVESLAPKVGADGRHRK